MRLMRGRMAWYWLSLALRAAYPLKERLAKIPHVVADPAPDVEILQFTLAGPVLAVRPYATWTIIGRHTLIRTGLSGIPLARPALLLRNSIWP